MDTLKQKRPIPILRKLIYSLLIVGLALVLCEIGLRFAGYETAAKPPSVEPLGDSCEAYYWISDWKLGFRNRANGKFQLERFPNKPIITTDENGFRNGIGWPGKPNKPIVLFIGDSFTFCAEVDDDRTCTSVAASKILADGYDVRVLNSGVRGYNAIQIYRLFEEIIDKYPNEIVGVVYLFCFNDSFQTVIPIHKGPIGYPTACVDKYGNLKVAEVQRLLVEEGSDFSNIDRDRYLTLPNRLAKHSVLYNLCLKGWRRLPLPDSFVDDGRSMGLSQLEGWEDLAARDGGWEVTRYLINKMNATCKERDAFFLISYVGNGGFDHEVESGLQLTNICYLENIPFVPLLNHMTEDRLSHHAFCTDGRRDAHFNEKGTKVVGEVLAPVIEKHLDQSETYRAMLQRDQ